MTAETLPLWPERGESDALNAATAVLDTAEREHSPSRRFLLFSGGNDSIVTLDALWRRADAIVHINTGIGIDEAHEFAREFAARYPLPFIELHPPTSYRELVLGVWGGFPGPGAHRFTFIRLKERCIEALLRDHRQRNGERFLLITGARAAESKRRMGHGQEIRRKGGQVWVNPLWSWTNDEMARYRAARSLPRNPVAEHLHMSGECMCGAMANQDQNREERAAVKFFFPEFERRLCELEAECRSAGLHYDEWGVKREVATIKEDPNILSLFDIDPEWMPLCSSCELRHATSTDER